MSQMERYPLEMSHLPECFLEKAKKELNEVPEQRTEELRKFKEMLSTDKTFAGIDFEDDFLWLFLRHAKHDSSRALTHLRNLIKFRRNYSHLFQSIEDGFFHSSPSTQCFSILPKRTSDGCSVILIEVGKWDPEEFPLEHFKRMFIFVILQTLRDPVTQINGFKIIQDYKDTNMKHLKCCTPQNIYLEYHLGMNCVPGRYREIHFINGSMVLTLFWSIAKLLFPKKIKQRVMFHSKPEDLLNFFPPDMIPTQWGGTLTDYHDENLLKKMNKEHGSYPIGGPKNYF
ncbi:retinaldehyde-binding protein 1-like isoform X2 [Argiope bruennichi]|uniref:Retinaldehyde-binding protein 1 like protein n=2 Tax=Argiope bruennichi TaxID=94029 RepID=A0A8T0ESG4_ARGBR|nr:retinaldehyde-binding protein 1-like isoform X2 [Argiope bruennichi]KAF8778892.1 Retinaldehyde-binding protein 1 like protein [Argiope bruennichi]